MNRNTSLRGSGMGQSSQVGRPKSKDEPEKGIWSSMLDSVASGRKLPEKQMIVFGILRTTMNKHMRLTTMRWNKRDTKRVPGEP